MYIHTVDMTKYPAKTLKSLNVLINDKNSVSSVTTLSEDITITGLALTLS
jgi:hypothetical protein